MISWFILTSADHVLILRYDVMVYFYRPYFKLNKAICNTKFIVDFRGHKGHEGHIEKNLNAVLFSHTRKGHAWKLLVGRHSRLIRE